MHIVCKFEEHTMKGWQFKYVITIYDIQHSSALTFIARYPTDVPHQRSVYKTLSFHRVISFIY